MVVKEIDVEVGEIHLYAEKKTQTMRMTDFGWILDFADMRMNFDPCGDDFSSLQMDTLWSCVTYLQNK